MKETGPRRQRGFETAGGLLRDRIRSVGESRGFAVSRLLTRWSEIVGEDVAAVALPARIGYGRDGLGATLTLLTTGSSAPLVQMMLPKVRDRVNACYGYNAIARVTVTQTAPTGFAEGRVAFAGAAKPASKGPADPRARAAARENAAMIGAGIGDEHLRAALEELGEKVLSRPDNMKG